MKYYFNRLKNETKYINQSISIFYYDINNKIKNLPKKPMLLKDKLFSLLDLKIKHRPKLVYNNRSKIKTN